MLRVACCVILKPHYATRNTQYFNIAQPAFPYHVTQELMAGSGFLPAPPRPPQLGEHEVHVWLADLEGPQESTFANVLAPDEQARAARFHFEKDRRHYIAARGVLRWLLGGYLGVTPESIEFQYNEHGKPWIAPKPPMKLEFNLSHSHGLALYGFTLERRIGVDIEWMERKTPLEELAQRFFAPAEVAALMSMPKELRRNAFFNGWTRKEAFIKAHGIGLSLGLEKFAVSLEDNSPALLSMEGEPQAPARWTLRAFDTREGYAAALAVEGAISQVKCWEWNGATE